MIEYFYSLDYQPNTRCHPEFDHDMRHEKSFADNASTTALGYHSFQQPEKEMGLNRSSKPNKPAKDLLTSFNPLSFHISMYSLAGRMFIEGLKTISKEKVERELKQCLHSDTFPQAIFEIYSSTPATDRGLRDLAVKMTMDHLTELRNGSECDHVAFPDSLVTEIPQFSSDLLVAIMNKSVSEWRRHGKCGTNWAQTDLFWS
jgi:hypothetical protein